jgi:BirA family biotin operon repressor/biotin-[acetyl-CoA-carboxylase] ligase
LTDALPGDFADAIDRARGQFGRLGSRIIFLASTPSTNDVASSLAAAGDAEGTVVIADAQTAGRGRRGHAWVSPPGSGLYVSVVVAPARASIDGQRATTLITLTAGVALAEAIEAAVGLRVDLKWPNDLYSAGWKLGGILAEGVAEAVVLGYGINVAAASLPQDLANRATSIEREAGHPIDRARVFAHSLAALGRRYDDLLSGRFDAILDEWRRRSPGGVGARVSWATPSGTQVGITAGIDDHGALLVDVDGRIERIVAGELTWL